nr:HAD hydrolase-like protein [Pseudoruegeria sp. HB172150]
MDLDGTLTDPKPGITGSAAYALKAVGLPEQDPEELTWMIGPALIDSFAKLGAADPAAALAAYREAYSGGGMFDCAVYDGIAEALAALRAAGHRLFLATAKPHVYAVQITERFGLDGYLEAQFGPEMDGTRNDKAELLVHALGQTGVMAETAVMVGDRVHDIVAGQKNGMATVGVRWGYGTDDELDQADAICEAPSDLPRVIETLLSGRAAG